MKNDDKKTALKLLGKYADSYSLLEEENKHLKSQIKDLKINLNINKEIIQGFMISNNEDKSQFYNSKLKEEIENLNETIKKMAEEKYNIEEKLNKKQQLLYTELTREKEVSEKLHIKLFILENTLIKKENLLEAYKKKNPTQNGLIYAVEPSKALNLIHEELEMYKNIYKDLTKNMLDLKTSLANYRKMNYTYDLENTKLKQEIKNIKMDKSLNANETELKGSLTQNRRNNSDFKIKPDLTSKISPLNDNKLNSPPRTNKSHNNVFSRSPNNSQLNLTILKQYETYEENNRKRKETFDYADDWVDTLKHCNMTQEEFVKYSRNKLMAKLVDSIEYLYKLVQEKNSQIRILTSEVEELNLKNLDLNKENILLYEGNIELRKNKVPVENKVQHLRLSKTKGDTGMDSSLPKDLSKGTIFSDVKKKLDLEKESDIELRNNYRTNTIESITSSEFRQGIRENILITENEENYVENILNVQNIKHI